MTRESMPQALMSGILTEETMALLRQSPMPEYDGAESAEIDITRIRKYMREKRFHDLRTEDQRWICCRLMPSLMRYVSYPPPKDV